MLCEGARRLKLITLPIRTSILLSSPSVETDSEYLMHYIYKTALVERLGISTRTLENWIVSRGFPAPLHINGSRIAFFKLSAVEAWFEDQLGGRQ